MTKAIRLREVSVSGGLTVLNAGIEQANPPCSLKHVRLWERVDLIL